MTRAIEAAARVIAHQAGKAVLVRERSEISPEPTEVFGIAPIKMVSEEIIQSMAYGSLDGNPQFVIRWNPLSREASNLEPFGEALHEYLILTLGRGEVPRIWVPHRAALTLIELLGHRYRTNREANETLRRMGWHCRVLAEEAAYAGQQVVAVATDLLTSHVASGQAPIKDQHLLALLAWVDPEPGKDPAEVADRRALEPAAAMLERPVDDRVEYLRKLAKGAGREAAKAKRVLEGLLQRGAEREWEMLMSARRAFLGLDLRISPRVGDLVRESRDRLTYRLSANLNPPSRPHSLSGLVDDHEFAIEQKNDFDTRSDRRVRERNRRKGRVFFAEVVSINQPVPSRKPCDLTLVTDQEVLRVRPGSLLSTLDARCVGRVTDIDVDQSTGLTYITIDLQKGVRRSSVPALNSLEDWMDGIPFDGRFMRKRAYAASVNFPLVGGTSLPAAVPRNLLGDLLSIAESLKQP